jgi:Uma2 family endonuclease
MSTQPKPHLTPEQYLEVERAAEFKSEYFDGEMLAMSGATFSHVTIVDNLTAILVGCRGSISNLRVQTEPTGPYLYPDILVYCDKPQFADSLRDTLTDATVVIEVLSLETELFDHTYKFHHYRSLGSFTDYILIAQDRVHVEHKHRKADGSWETIETYDPEAVIQLPSIECALRVGDVYDAVEFEPE